MKTEIMLDGVWRFQPDPFGEGEAFGYAASDFDDSRWREAMVPCVFDRCGEGMQGYEGAGWFRRIVNFIPADWSGKRILLNFGAVNHHAAVWVNGEQIGENVDGFLPFSLDVSKYLRPGSRNSIVVRADNTRRAGDVPGLLRGWRPFGGIIRPVTLVASDALHLGRIAVTAGADGAYKIKVEVLNERETEAITQTWVFLRGAGDSMAMPNGQGFGERPMAPGKRSRLTLDGQMENPALWSPDSPTLYRAIVELHEDQVGVIDRREVTFGFRTIGVENGHVMLNGDPVLLIGFNRHEDSLTHDMCANPELARQDLLRMKATAPQGGVNFVRLCHYPHDPGTLDICDEIGLLAMCEIPLYWWGDRDEDHDVKRENAKRQLTRLIERDFNHPSVLFWSVSNETNESLDAVWQGNAELIRLAKSLDPTRLATHVSNRWTRTPHFEEDDVLCVNDYPTWGGRQWGGNPSLSAEEASKRWRVNLAKLHEQYPDKPIVVAEFGYPAIAGIAQGGIGEEAQAQALTAELTDILDAGTFMSGATVWCWADHPWAEDNWLRYLTTSPFGVVSRDRKSKKGYDALKTVLGRRPSLLLRRPDLNDLPVLSLPEGYTLRVGVPEDAEGLASCLQKAFPEMTWTPENATNWLLTEPSVKTVFVIEHDTQIVATASARLLPEEFPGSGYIHWVGGDPEHRGKRLGYLASLATLQEFVRLGCQDAVLHTDDPRIPAIKVYLALGFRPDNWHATHPSRWGRLRHVLGERL